MRTRASGWGLSLVLSSAAACGDGASRVGSSAGQPLCPNCQRAGGESSDFSGSGSPCYSEPAPDPEDPQWTARLDEVRAVYAGPFEATLGVEHASRGGRTSADDVLLAPPSGYEPATRVSGNITLGEAQFTLGRQHPDPTGYQFECPDQFHIPVTVELATADGAIAGTAYGSITVGGEPSIVRARIDLADAVGGLDLHLDPAQDYWGGIYLRLDFYPGAKHGQIAVRVGLGEPGPGEVSGPTGFPDAVGGRPVFEAYLPDDGCGANGLRSTADAPVPWLEGQTTAQLLDAWATEIGATTTPAQSRYCADDGLQDSRVEVSFELGAPDLDGVCQQPAWAAGETEGRLRFASPSRLRTSDGLIDTPLLSGALTPQGLRLRGESLRATPLMPEELIPAERFEDESGMLGLDLERNAAFHTDVSAEFSRSEGSPSVLGSAGVVGYACASGRDCSRGWISHLEWPPGVFGFVLVDPICEP